MNLEAGIEAEAREEKFTGLPSMACLPAFLHHLGPPPHEWHSLQ